MRVSAHAATAFLACSLFALTGCVGETSGDESGEDVEAAADEYHATTSKPPTTGRPATTYRLTRDSSTGALVIKDLQQTYTQCPIMRAPWFELTPQCTIRGIDVVDVGLDSYQRYELLNAGSTIVRGSLFHGAIVIGSRQGIVIGSRNAIVIGSKNERLNDSAIVIGSRPQLRLTSGVLAIAKAWTSPTPWASWQYNRDLYSITRTYSGIQAQNLKGGQPRSLGASSGLPRYVLNAVASGETVLAAAPPCGTALPTFTTFFSGLEGDCAGYQQQQQSSCGY